MINKYRRDIDGLRAWSVLAVVLFHAKIFGFEGGFVGVDVFFVISGFLITNNLKNEFEATKTISLFEFYQKRIKRLFPSIFIVSLITILLWIFLLSGIPSDSIHFLKSSIYSLIGFANFFFFFNSNGYFDGPGDEQPFLHFWSLAVEEQFYFLWPLFILLILKYLKKIHYLQILLCIMICLSFALNIFFVSTNRSNLAFFMVPTRAWQFAIGAFLVFHQNRKPFHYLLEFLIFALGFLLITVPVVLFSSETIYPGIAAIYPTLGATILIFSGNSNFKYSFTKILENRMMVKIGILSYGVYLWHWPLFSISQIYNYGILPPVWTRLMLIVLSFILAEATLKYVEGPVRLGRLKKLSPSKTFLFFILGVLLLVSLKSVFLIFEQSSNSDLIRYVEERTTYMNDCLNNVDNLGSEKCIVSNSFKSTTRIYVYGDSHAFSIFPMFEQLSKQSDVEAVLFANSSSPPLLPVFNSQFENKFKDKEVNTVNKKVLSEIEKSIQQFPHKKHVLFIASRWMRYFGDSHVELAGFHTFIDKNKSKAGSLKVFEESLRLMLSRMNEIGIQKIILLLPTPEFRASSKHCLRSGLEKCHTTRKLHEEYVSDVTKVIKRVAEKYKNIRVIDPASFSCTMEICNQFLLKDGSLYPAVFDTNHHSVKFSKEFGSFIVNDLNWLIN